MVDATNARQRDDLGVAGRSGLDRPVLRAVSIEGEVAPVLVVVGDVTSNLPAGVGFVEDNNVVEEFSPEASDPPFSNAVLPGRTESDSDGFHTCCTEPASDSYPECRVSVMNDEPGAGYRLEGFPQLLDHPL